MSDLAESVSSQRFLRLDRVEEVRYGALRVIVAAGKEDANETSLDIAGVRLSGLHRVSFAAPLPRFELIFSSYIAYAVTNESYALQCGGPGRYQVLHDSAFLDFVRRTTFATRDYPGPFAHYRVAGEDRVLDVAACAAPQIATIAWDDPAPTASVRP